MKMPIKIAVVLTTALTLAACSGDDNNDAMTDMATGADTSTGADTNTSQDTGTTTTDMGGNEDLGPAADLSAPEDMGGNEDMDGTPDMTPPGHLEAHGCTFETATDMTGTATLSITDIDDWVVGHNVCLIVTTGTVVSWTGNFTSHPLDGGEAGTADPANPIDIAGDGVTGQSTVDVTFDTAGDYPYYCVRHAGSMRGIVYVVD